MPYFADSGKPNVADRSDRSDVSSERQKLPIPPD